MNETCLVTGGAGFIGSALSSELVRLFKKVIYVDNLHPQIHAKPIRPDSLAKEVELMIGDVTEAAVWDNVLKMSPPSLVIHLAAETGTGQSLSESYRHSHTNVCGTTVMLDSFTRNNCIPERIVLSSSRAVYGEGAWISEKGEIINPGQRTREQLSRAEWDFTGYTPLPSKARSTQPSPVSVYGATKLAQEHVLSSWTNAFGAKLVTLRLQNVFGPGQSLKNSYTGIVSLFCQLAKQGQSIPLYEDGLMLRDFVLIDDVASAFIHAIKADNPDSGPFDVGSGVATTIGEVANRIAKIYNAPEPHVCAKFRFGDVRHASCDITATTEALNWKPQFDIDQGLKRLSTWIDTQLAK